MFFSGFQREILGQGDDLCPKDDCVSRRSGQDSRRKVQLLILSRAVVHVQSPDSSTEIRESLEI